jgi:hypothetical protein
MKSHKLISLAWAVVVAPLTGITATSDVPEASPSAATPAAPATDPLSQLSPPVLSLVKMINSGVSQDVIEAYIKNSPTSFNLTADDIIRLQGLGVQASLVTEMLNHDKALRDNPALAGAPAPAAQPPAVTAPYVPSDSDVYNNLAPYGYWGNSPGYGPYWQPYGTLAYGYYPWTWLSFGFWWNYPGHGWCWSPHSHFHSFNHFHSTGFNSFHGTHGSFNHTHGTTTSLATGIRNFGSSTASRTGTTTTMGSTHVQNSPWVTSFNGGFHGSSGFHGSTASGFRTGGSGTFRGGTGSGFQTFHTGTGGSFHGGTGGGWHGGGGGFHGGGGGSHGGSHGGGHR